MAAALGLEPRNVGYGWRDRRKREEASRSHPAFILADAAGGQSPGWCPGSDRTLLPFFLPFLARKLRISAVRRGEQERKKPNGVAGFVRLTQSADRLQEPVGNTVGVRVPPFAPITRLAVTRSPRRLTARGWPVAQGVGRTCGLDATVLYFVLQPLAQAHQPFGSMSRRSGDTWLPQRRQ